MNISGTSTEFVKSALQTGEIRSSQKTTSGTADWESISLAIASDNLDAVKALTKKLQINGTDVNQIPGQRNLVDIAVEKAIDTGHLDILEHLIRDCGGDIKGFNSAQKENAAANAIRYAHAQIESAKSDPCKVSALGNHVRIVVKFLSHAGDTFNTVPRR